MLITGQEIIDRQLLEGAVDNSLRGASYYLKIGCIIPAGDEAREFEFSNSRSSHTLPPGGLAWVISQEIFNITDFSVTALVTLRSNFTKQGMLALDVGLVDANYRGEIGSIVINFSKNNILLSKGDEFFRVIFFEHKEVEEKFRYPRIEYADGEYIKERLRSLTSDFPSSFMQADQIEERVSAVVQKNVVSELKIGLADRIILSFLKNHWKKCLAFIVALGAGIIAFDRFILPSVFTADMQKAMVCKMIDGKIFRHDVVPKGTCD